MSAKEGKAPYLYSLAQLEKIANSRAKKIVSLDYFWPHQNFFEKFRQGARQPTESHY